MYPPQPPPFGQQQYSQQYAASQYGEAQPAVYGSPQRPQQLQQQPDYGSTAGQRQAYAPQSPSYLSQGQPPQQYQYAQQPQYQQYHEAHQPYAASITQGPAGPGLQAPAAVPPGGPGGFMPSFSPMNLMTAGSILSSPQQWGSAYMEKMQQKMGWLSGGALSALFNVNRSYVLSKMLMLLAPYLRRWTYTRLHEQIAGGQKYRPPRADPNAPDLYIPLMAMWTYTLLTCAATVLSKSFKPELMYASLWSASMAWLAHLLVAKLLLRAMSLSGVSWLELLAYSGYPFVPVCISTLVGFVAGKTGYYVAFGYGSLCMGIFLVRSMKRIIFQEARHYTNDLALTNYLLLALALFQFPFAFWLGIRPAK